MLQNIFSWVDERYNKIAIEEAIMNNGRISGTVLRLADGLWSGRSSAPILPAN